MSQILEMAQRLQDAERTIAELQNDSSKTALTPQTRTPQTVDDSFAAPEPRRPSMNAAEFEESPRGGIRMHARTISTDSTPKEVLPDLSLDQNGKICYYGPTSAVHDPPSLNSPVSQPPIHTDTFARPQARSWLAAKAKESRTWESFALGSAAIQSDIPREVISKLLNIHWTWISPMFMWVYRPAFIHDMSTGGRYYSEFLLIVLCAHAARFHDFQVAEMLISKARLLLGSAIHQPSSIPTIQALLQLSARDLAFGLISQAWLYSGMAFRMAFDLGLHHNGPITPNPKDSNPMDMEVRRRVFWSCYFWDKAISLYTGRMPALSEVPENVDCEFLDDSSEMDIWSPICTDTIVMAISEYPERRAHYVSCFANSCKLSVIINDIAVNLYSRRNVQQLDTSLERIMAKLATWRAESPPHLKYHADDLPEVCPPPHIISQNLLYYTSVILAHRPFWSLPVHYEACITAAHSIEKLLVLLGRTFGFDNITYLMAYCIYTGASALLQDAKNGNPEAVSKIQTFIQALSSGAKKAPLLKRSVDLINKGLKTPIIQRTQSGSSISDPMAYRFIPAFPYYGSTADGDFDMGLDPGSINVSAFSTLDCFPEAHMNFGTWDCPPTV